MAKKARIAILLLWLGIAFIRFPILLDMRAVEAFLDLRRESFKRMHLL